MDDSRDPIGPTPPDGRTRGRRRRRGAVVAAGLLVAGAALGGGVALAVGPSFSDVPEGHQFYDEIEWMAASGISTGYPDGTYRPGVAVSRQAMSAFMLRLAEVMGDAGVAPELAGFSTTSPEFVSWTFATGTVTLPPGYHSNVKVTFNAQSVCFEADGLMDPAGCEVRLLVDGSPAFSGARTLTFATPSEQGLRTAVWLVRGLTPGSHTVQLQARQDHADGELDSAFHLSNAELILEVLSEPAPG